MKISAGGRYAVRLMADIAKHQDFVPLKEVAKRQNVSLKYAEQLIGKLTKEKLLISSRGQDGGYKLFLSSEKCSIYSILVATGDITESINCVKANCPNLDKCVGVDVWVTLNDKINDYLRSVTLKDLIAKDN